MVRLERLDWNENPRLTRQIPDATGWTFAIDPFPTYDPIRANLGEPDGITVRVQ